MSRDKFSWDGSYVLRDGSRTRKRSQGAYDAQKNGLFPIEEAATYISRALKVSKQEAEEMLVTHRKNRLHQRGSSGDEWHHVGPNAKVTDYFDARELAVWKKLEAADANWLRSICEGGYRGGNNIVNRDNGISNEIKRLADSTGLKEDKIRTVYSRAIQVVPQAKLDEWRAPFEKKRR